MRSSYSPMNPDVVREPLRNWSYRREISLDPPTTGGDCVMLVTLTAEMMGNPYQSVNADGSDLRFTGPDDKWPLAYWIESWDNTGTSRVWVKVKDAGTKSLYVYFGNPQAQPVSQGTAVFAFFDDFSDGIWRKYPGNPVLTRTEAWEARAICEPTVLVEDGIFKTWYMGCSTSEGTNAALGYATSPDGFFWTKDPNNPILRDPAGAIIRTTLVKHEGVYHLFASDYQWNDASGVINRWTSADGLHWGDKVTVLEPGEPWEGPFENTGVIVDEDGTWHMLYTMEGPMGYAYSPDGVHWTKYEGNPVIAGFYGGDPCLRKIGDRYFIWHSREHKGHLRIGCMASPDMIHWTEVGNGPQIGYTQPWEHGVGRPEVHWDRHLTDADLVEHDGQVWMIYQGAQNPLGVATFDGTYEALADRLLNHPPLSRWALSPYGMVEDQELKISDGETDLVPLYENVAEFDDRTGYVFELRAQRYAGVTYLVKAVCRYGDERNFAGFALVDDNTTLYQEVTDGQLQRTVGLGPNLICDGNWHQWRIAVRGEENELFLDGRRIGSAQSGPHLVGRADLKVGLSVYDCYASFDDVRVRAYNPAEPTATVGRKRSVVRGGQ